MNPYYVNGPLNWFWPIGWLVFLAICIMCLRFVFWGGRGRRWDRYSHDHGHTHEDPLTAAKLRYAKGDITKDEFEAIKKDLRD